MTTGVAGALSDNAVVDVFTGRVAVDSARMSSEDGSVGAVVIFAGVVVSIRVDSGASAGDIAGRSTIVVVGSESDPKRRLGHGFCCDERV